MAGELIAAQSKAGRHPLVKIISSPMNPEIPFSGKRLTDGTLDEEKPDVIAHTLGRMIIVYRQDNAQGGDSIKYVYTDDERLVFNVAELPIDGQLIGVAVTELITTVVGLAYITLYNGTYRLYAQPISVDGTALPGYPAEEIDSWASDSTAETSGPSVCTCGPTLDNYIIVYARENGANYSIFQWFSPGGFTFWQETEIPMASLGLSNSNKASNPYIHHDAATGDLYLFFDYVDSISNGRELTNIYYSVSSDNGATWGNAVKVTDYDTYDTVGSDPMVAESSTGATIAYTERITALHMDAGTTFYCGGAAFKIQAMQFDKVNRKLYVRCGEIDVGNKHLYCVIKVDVDTWIIDDCYTCGLLEFNDIFCEGDGHVWWDRWYGDGQYVPVGLQSGGGDAGNIAVLNGETGAIVHYAFKAYPAYSILKNIAGFEEDHFNNIYLLNISCCQIVGTLMYVMFHEANVSNDLLIGTINLTDPGAGSPPQYAFTPIVEMDGTCPNYGCDCLQMLIVPEENIIVVPYQSMTGASYFDGALLIFDITSGALLQSFTPSVSSMPKYGVSYPAYSNGKLYFSFPYSAEATEENKFGLCELDMATWAFNYHRPSYMTANDYGLKNKVVTEDGELVIATSYGITIFNPNGTSWNGPDPEHFIYNNASVPGLTNIPFASTPDLFASIAYDDTGEMIFGGHIGTASADCQLVAFSINGYFQKALYIEGTLGVWNFADREPLVQSNTGYDPSILYDEEDSLYAFWTWEHDDTLSIKWAKEMGDIDMGEYLANEEVTVRRSIDGSPGELNFTVSHGHLFDPQNTTSLLSTILEKGRKISIQFGEHINFTDYWMNQGVFLVTGTALKYRRGDYPWMTVTAEDIFSIWADHDVIATEGYSASPEEVITSLVTTFTNWLEADLSLPVFDTSVTIYPQWIEKNLLEMIVEVCNRFGYFPFIDNDGKLSARKIAETNAVDHTYVDLSKVLDFTPDDSFSDHINRVTITGEEHDFVEVTYDEEAVRTMNGTVGWWGYKKTFTIWYSDDRTKTCINPRLNKLESVASMMLEAFGGVEEYLSGEDPEHKYCEVTIEAPNLLPLFIATVAGIAATYLDWDLVIVYGSHGKTISVASAIRTTLIVLALNILGSTGSYQYEIYAHPLGNVRRKIQASADDLEYQQKIGMVVEKTHDEPLCYTVAQCKELADFELMVVKLQRQRVKFTKIADLNDEIGFSITIPHPFSQQTMKIFITELTRRYKKPNPGEENSGHFFDDVEGWVIK